jgi:hypothetical protein
VGSLKKGKSLTPIPPTAYSTLPSHAHIQARAAHHHQSSSSSSSPENGGLAIPLVHAATAHKRSPSTDSGNAGSRSTTPVSYRLGKADAKPKCARTFYAHYVWAVLVASFQIPFYYKKRTAITIFKRNLYCF